MGRLENKKPESSIDERNKKIKDNFPGVYEKIKELMGGDTHLMLNDILAQVVKELEENDKKDLIKESLIYHLLIGSTPSKETLEKYNPAEDAEVILNFIEKILEALQSKKGEIIDKIKKIKSGKIPKLSQKAIEKKIEKIEKIENAFVEIKEIIKK